MSDHKSLAEALLAFQKNPPKIELDATNPHFRSKFASLPHNLPKIRKRLTEEGLVLLQPLDNLDGHPAIRTILLHPASGQELVSVTPLLLGGKYVSPDKGKTHQWIPPHETDPQAHGSAISYDRRYALLSILGLVGDEDDDGNASSAPSPHSASGAGPSSPPDAGADDLPEFAPDMPDAEPEQEAFQVPNDGITDKQLKFLKMLAEKLIKDEGNPWSVEMFRKHLSEQYGVTSTKGLTKKQATEAIEHIKGEAVAAGLIEA